MKTVLVLEHDGDEFSKISNLIMDTVTFEGKTVILSLDNKTEEDTGNADVDADSVTTNEDIVRMVSQDPIHKCYLIDDYYDLVVGYNNDTNWQFMTAAQAYSSVPVLSLGMTEPASPKQIKYYNDLIDQHHLDKSFYPEPKNKFQATQMIKLILAETRKN